MPTNIDELQIEINANAKKANTAIDNLVKNLGAISASLGGLKNATGLTTLAQGVERLSTAMQSFSGVPTKEFTRLANNITNKLNAINVSNLSSVSASVNHMATAFNNLGNVSQNALSIGEMAKNIAKLGNKSVQTAITNIPQLAVAMRDLLTTLSTAPNVSRNIIDMTNALANLANQGSRVGSASRSIVRGMNNTTSSMNRARKSTTSLAAAFGKFYATWFLVIRGAKQFINAIEGTADYIEAYNYYNVALGKIASEWNQDWEKYGYANAEAYADSFTDRLNKSLSKLSGLQIDESQQLLTETGLKNLGLNIQEITQYASQLASITNSVGQTGEVSLAASSAFTKLAGDMSSLFNVDYSSVFGNLQSALIGQSRAVYKYGIDITNATLQTYAYNLGLEKAVSEMTQAEKMQLRMIAILDQSKVSWGDLANTINSPSNMLRQFSNNVKEAGMVLGQLFIPVLQKVLPVVNGVVIAIKRLLVSIAQLLGVKLDLDSFGQGYADLTDGFDDMADSLDGVADSAKKLNHQLAPLDELNNLSLSQSGGSGGVGGGAIDLTDEILKATGEYEKIWQEAYDRMANKAQEIADRISKTLEPVRKIFEDFAVGDFFQAGEDTSHLVASILDFFAKAIDKVDWYGIGEKIGDFLAGIDWISVFKAIGRFVWEGINAGIELWAGSFNNAPFETTFFSILALPAIVGFGSKLIKFIVGPFEDVYKLIAPLMSKISGSVAKGGIFATGGAFEGMLAPILGITAAVSGLAIGLGYVYAKNEKVRESFSQAISAIQDGLQPAIEFFDETILPDLQAGWERIVEILTPLGEFLQTAFTSIWQDMINPALTYVGEKVLPILTGAFENLWNNVLVPLGTFLGNVLSPVIQIVSDALSILWKNVVEPLAGAIGNVLGKAFEGLVEIFNKTVVPILGTVISVFQFLWNNVLEPIVDWLWGKMKPVFETVFKAIGGIIDGLGKSFGGLIDFIVGVFTLNWEKAWNGVKDVFKGIFNGLISIAEGIVNLIIGGLNSFFGNFSGLVTGIGDAIGVDISIPVIPEVSIPRFELGGFPEPYSLFAAGEGGRAELLGTVGGQTAVAGGAEITGIRDAIFSSHNEEMELMRQQNELLRGILEKEFGITERQIGKAAANYSRDYKKRTGKTAYSF